MRLSWKVVTICLVLGVAALTAACGAAQEARQSVGEVLVGEPTPAPGITSEDIDALLETVFGDQEFEAYSPFEICGNGIDDDQDGKIDADDAGCQFPDEVGAPLSQETVRKLEPTGRGEFTRAGGPCVVGVFLKKIVILTDNEAGDDEFVFEIKTSVGDARFPTIGEHVVPGGSTLPLTITVNKLIGPKILGRKGQAVPVTIAVTTKEIDLISLSDDIAFSDTVEISNCPHTGSTRIRTWSFPDDVHALLYFTIIWDP